MARVFTSSRQFNGSSMELPRESPRHCPSAAPTQLHELDDADSSLPTPEACLFAISGMPAASGIASQGCRSVRRLTVPLLLTLCLAGLVLRTAELFIEILWPVGRSDLLQPNMLMAVVLLLYCLECLVTHAVIQLLSTRFSSALDGLQKFCSQFDSAVDKLRRRSTRLTLIACLACICLVPLYYLAVQFAFDGERTRLISVLESRAGTAAVAGMKAAKCLTFSGQVTGWFSATGFYLISIEHLGCAAVAFSNHVTKQQSLVSGLQAKFRNLAKLAEEFDSLYSALAAASIVCCTVYVTVIMYAVVKVIGVDWVGWFEKTQLLLWLSMAIAKMFLVMWQAARLNDRMFGVLATYFIVLLQFNQASVCNCWCNGTSVAPLS